MKQVLVWIFVIIIATVFAFVGCAFLEDQWNAQAEELQRVDQRVDDLQLREDLQVDRSAGDRSLNATLPDDGVVRYNCLPIRNPLIWNYNRSNVTSTTQLFYPYNDDFFYHDERVSTFIGRAGSSVGSIVGNVLTNSISGVGGNYVFFDIRLSRSYLLGVLSDYNSLYSIDYTSLNFTVNVNVLDSFYLFQVWGRSSFNGPATALVAAQATSVSGIRSLLLDLDTYNYNYYSFVVQTYGQLSINGMKLEVGSDFTGFVYDDYNCNGYEYGYNDGFVKGRSVGVNDVETYNQGFDLVGEYCIFSDSSYSDINFVNSGSMSIEPYFIYNGTGSLYYDSAAHFLAWYNSSGASSITKNIFAINNNSLSSTYVIAFHFSAPLGAVNMRFSVNGFSEDFTVGVYGKTYFCKVDTYLGFTLSLLSENATVFIDNFKIERSDYFTGFPVGSFSTDSYNNGYSAGYDNGFTIGYDEGFDAGDIVGTSSGYQEGYTAGHIVGYSDGISDVSAIDGSWYGLFSALIDVPVSTITGFLDINVLGFNFLSLFRTLVLFSLFVYVIRLLVGKYGV